MKIVKTLSDLRESVKGAESLGFVPTMGALHQGHLSLVKASQSQCQKTVVSIFVNPTQFGPREDFSTYPRPLEKDIKLLRGIDILYLPTVEEIYPEAHPLVLSVPSLSHQLCGRIRPQHFQGVATVVGKLLCQVRPQKAFFGEKDFQQIRVIESLVDSLCLPVDIVRCPTYREADGLAASSRNAYLSSEERILASSLYESLSFVKSALEKGGDIEGSLQQGREKLKDFQVDYFELCAEDSLLPSKASRIPLRLVAAMHLGKARLIDNVPVMRP